MNEQRRERVRCRIWWLLVLLVPSIVVADEATPLKILDLTIEPIQQGTNVVRARVQNHSQQDRIFWMHIYTRSPNLGRSGVGWGLGSPATVAAEQTLELRFPYKIQGPLDDETWIRITCFHAGLSAGFSYEDWRGQEKNPEPLIKQRYNCTELEQVEQTPGSVVTADLQKSIHKTFSQLQQSLKKANYEQAWQQFTPDYQQAEYHGHDVQKFLNVMTPTRLIETAFHWEKEAMLRLEPIRVTQYPQHITLLAEDPQTQETWTFTWKHNKNQWKIYNITGHTMPCQRWLDWDKRLLPQLQKHDTPHYTIYTYPNSSAARDIEDIAQKREKALSEIASFWGAPTPEAMRLILFEDQNIKFRETGHQGMGWAFDRTIVEVYNTKEQLDPFHETTHILASGLGHPPALFNEGLAVYMSEKLGAKALEDLGGGGLSINQRTTALRQAGTWIPLQELITYQEIGSHESQPRIAYAEAASFVKFLIETYGKENFVAAYSQLQNTNRPKIQQENRKLLGHIYGKPLKTLEEEWLAGLE